MAVLLVRRINSRMHNNAYNYCSKFYMFCINWKLPFLLFYFLSLSFFLSALLPPPFPFQNTFFFPWYSERDSTCDKLPLYSVSPLDGASTTGEKYIYIYFHKYMLKQLKVWRQVSEKNCNLFKLLLTTQSFYSASSTRITFHMIFEGIYLRNDFILRL